MSNIDFNDCSRRTIALLESQINPHQDPSYILAKIDIIRNRSKYLQEWDPATYSEKLAKLWYPTRVPGWLTKGERDQAYDDTIKSLRQYPQSHVNQFASVIIDVKNDLDCCTPRRSDHVRVQFSGTEKYFPQSPGQAFVDSLLSEDLPTLLEVAEIWNANIQRYSSQWEWETNRSCWRNSLYSP